MANIAAYRELADYQAGAFITYDEADQRLSPVTTTPNATELPIVQEQGRAAAHHFIETVREHFGEKILNFAFPIEEQQQLKKSPSFFRNSLIQEVLRRADGVDAALANYPGNDSSHRIHCAIRDYTKKELQEATAAHHAQNPPSRTPLAEKATLNKKRPFIALDTIDSKKPPVSIATLAATINVREHAKLRWHRAQLDLNNAHQTLNSLHAPQKQTFGLQRATTL